MIGNRTLQVGMLCYPKLTQLDLTGPYEVLSGMPDTQVHVLWKDTVPVRTESGLCIVADLKLGTRRNSTSWSCLEGLGNKT